MPIISHINKRSQVTPGKLYIHHKENSTPRIGTTGTHGVLNGRGKSGLRRRSTHTPAETMANASNVPMFTMYPSLLVGREAASSATKKPTPIVEIHGVRKRGWITLKKPGRSLSRDIEKKTRDCPSSMTTIVLVRPI